MKKLLLLCLWLPGVAFAQEADSVEGSNLFSKKGFPILPEAGDFSIGFDAVPFLEYAGNFFSGSTGRNYVSADFPNATQQVVGKYFLNSNTAIRGRFRFRFASDVDRNRVILDNQSIPDPNIQVVDERMGNANFVQLGVGLEKRRGSGRLYGIYGGEVSFFSSKTKNTYEYGNPFSLGNQTPTFTTGGNFNTTTNGSERITESLSERTIGAGLNGFVGVEYFFAPKMGISAEFTYGLTYGKNLRGQNTYEFWDTNTGNARQREEVTEGGNEFTLDTGNYGGAINLFFYF